ncbi:MAG: sulfatase-like hydrolase/transferase, partial [Bacillota bacterium]
GKWHLGFDWITKDGKKLADVKEDKSGWDENGFDIDYSQSLNGGPIDCGFDYYFGISASLDMPPYCFIENDKTVGIPDREKEIYYNQQRKGLQTPGWKDEEVDITFANKAVEFIENQSQNSSEQPFFLYLPTAAPHRPCDIRPDFVKGKSDAGDRGDMVVLFDWAVGQVINTLDRLEISENTLLIVTSDNGARATCANGKDYGHKSNGDWRGQKADIWEGGHREPFIARWPQKIESGSSNDETICFTDLFATFAAITDSDIPEDDAEDSYNILAALKGENKEKSIREATVHHSLRGHFSIRKGKWKLICQLGSGGFTDPKSLESEINGPQGQLYNLKKDPEETNNLWQKRPDIIKELTQLLNKYKQEDRSVLVN